MDRRIETHTSLLVVGGLLLSAALVACSGEIGLPPGQAEAPGADTAVDGQDSLGSTDTGSGLDGDTADPDTLPGTDTVVPPSTCEQQLVVGPTPMRRLTNVEYAQSVEALLGLGFDAAQGLPDDDAGHGFDNDVANANISQLRAERMLDVAETIADAVEDDPGAFLPCLVDAPDETCVRDYLRDFGLYAWRRPLSDEELDVPMSVYTSLQTDAGFAPAEAFGAALGSMVMAPQFIYRPEVGDATRPADEGLVALSGYEIATRLSYFLWNTTPDATLLAAAAAGELDTAEGIEQHARRMLADPQARASVGRFAEQWLHLERLETATRDADWFPEYDEALAHDFVEQTRRFFEYAVYESPAGFDELVAGRQAPVNASLADFYGVDPGIPLDDDTWISVELGPERAGGFMTLAGFLTANAQPRYPSPVHRGLFVRTQLLCQTIDAPPAGAADAVVSFPPDATNRERKEAHASDPLCATCHNLIDPPGFAFETFNAIGRHATTEISLEGNEVPIDPAGQLWGTDVDGPFDDAAQMAARLVDSDAVFECVVRQWFRYAHGRHETGADSCSLTALEDRLAASGGDFKELMVELMIHDTFRYRRVVTD